MGGRETSMDGRETRAFPFGDFVIGDVFESVVYWLDANRKTLDALSHACTAMRRHLEHSPDFGNAVFVCRRGCHLRCYTPRKRLAVKRVKFEAIQRLRACIHNLQGLSIKDSVTTTNDELAALLSFCPNITELGIGNCETLTDACTTAISRYPITSLDISDCSALLDSGLKEISRCPIAALNLGWCRGITDAGLKEISLWGWAGTSCCPHPSPFPLEERLER